MFHNWFKLSVSSTLLSLVLFSTDAFAQSSSSTMIITNHEMGSVGENAAQVRIRGQFDLPDSDGIYRIGGEAFVWMRWPGEGWIRVGDNSTAARSFVVSVGSSAHAREFQLTQVRPAALELKVCRQDGSTCSNSYLVKTTPLYRGDSVIKRALGSAAPVKISMDPYFGGPVKVFAGQTVGTIGSYFDLLWQAGVSCTGNTCLAALPFEVLSKRGRYFIAASTRTGQMENSPSLQIWTPPTAQSVTPAQITTRNKSVDVRIQFHEFATPELNSAVIRGSSICAGGVTVMLNPVSGNDNARIVTVPATCLPNFPLAPYELQLVSHNFAGVGSVTIPVASVALKPSGTSYPVPALEKLWNKFKPPFIPSEPIDTIDR